MFNEKGIANDAWKKALAEATSGEDFKQARKAVLKMMNAAKKIPLKRKEIWTPGRVFVYNEECQVEYFLRFEKYDGNIVIRSFCGGLRPIELCRPLDYVCDPKYLRQLKEIWSKEMAADCCPDGTNPACKEVMEILEKQIGKTKCL